MHDTTVCCIIISYNPDYVINKCIQAIYNQVDEIIIVDNGSKVNLELVKVLENDAKIKVIYNENNLGIACALNSGIQYALSKKYSWILTMDQDSEATDNMVENMFYVFNNLSKNEKEKIISIFPSYIEKALFKPDITNNINQYINKTNSTSKETLNVEKAHYVISEITSGNLIKCEVFKTVGLFEEKLFIDYVDHEFCLRLGKYGYKLIQVENAYLLHKLGDISKNKVLFKEVKCTNHSYIRRYYMTRNRMYVWKKYFKYYPKLIITDVVASVKELIKIIFCEKDKRRKIKMIIRGKIDFYNNKFGEFDEHYSKLEK